MRYIIVMFLLLAACSMKKVNLSEVIEEDVSVAALTLAVVDIECNNAYDSWLVMNRERIEKTKIRRGMRIHQMVEREESVEYVVVVASKYLEGFRVDVDKFDRGKSKLLKFGVRANEVTKGLEGLFVKSLDVTHECK